MVSQLDRVEEARKQLNILFPRPTTDDGKPLFFGIWSKDDRPKNTPGFDPAKPTRHFPCTPEDIAAAAEYGVAKSAPPAEDGGRGVFVTVTAHGSDLGSHVRGDASHKLAAGELRIDLDGKPPEGQDSGHAAQNASLWSEPQVVEAVTALSTHMGQDFAPTMIVDTGGGWHLYWCLDAYGDPNRVADVCAALQDFFRRWGLGRGDGGANLVVDGTADSPRVLRLAGTFNHKTAQRRRVSIDGINSNEDGSPRRYNLDAIASKLPAATSASKKSKTGKSIDSLDPKVLDQLVKKAQKVLRKKADHLLTEGNQLEYARLSNLLEGIEIVGICRNDNLWSLIGQVCGYLQGNDLDTVAAVVKRIFAPSMAAMRAGRPDDSEFGEHEKMIDRTVEDFRKQRAKQAEESARRQREAKEYERARVTPVQASDEDVCPPLPADDGEPYSLALIEYRIRQQSRLSGFAYSMASFAPRIGVRMPQGDCTRGFSFRTGDYTEMTQGAFVSWLRREIGRFPRQFYDVNTSLEDENGDAIPKSFDQILAELTIVPDEMNNEGGPIVGRLDIQTSYYDPVNCQMVQAYSPLRNLEPRHEPRFDQLLEAALPNREQRERLKDHLAASLDLSWPSSAPHIRGPRKTFKTGIVMALARCYCVTGATPGNLFYSQFNEWDNPIISHDEKPTKNEHGDVIEAADHRETITRQTHVINKKNARKRMVKGHTRHWFTENKDKMLVFSGQDETEMKATAERFDSFVFDQAAADLIASWGGREYMRTLLETDALTRHIFWLAKERLPRLIADAKRRGSRMLVDGNMQTSMADLLQGDRSAGRVLHFICRYIENAPPRSINQPPAVLTDNGVLNVSADSLIREWGNVMPHERKSPPELGQIVDVLKHYAVDATAGSKQIKRDKLRGRYWQLDATKVIAYAEKLGAWDTEAIRNALHGRHATLKGDEVAA